MSPEWEAGILTVGLIVFSYGLYRFLRWYFLDSIGLK
jgi:hypothetical protein